MKANSAHVPMKYTAKKLVFVLTIIISYSYANAQQDFTNGFYMYNPSAFNAGIVGVNDVIEATGIYRNQWTGLNGAPKTQYVVLQAPLYELFDRFDTPQSMKYPTGISGGLSLVNDQIGASQFTSVRMPIAYRVRLNENGVRLSLGLSAELSMLSFNLNKLRQDAGDIMVTGSPRQTFVDFASGAYMYHKLWYIGVSFTNFRARDYGKEFGYVFQRQLYLSVGYAYELNANVVLRATGLGTYTKNAPYMFIASPAIIIQQNIECGVSYRINDMAGVHFSFKPIRNVRVGYWYEYPMGIKKNLIGHTHEFMLHYTFKPIKKKVINPRYFW